jgi:hypothetical protein
VRRALPLTVLTAAVVAGCGTPSADLMLVQRTGTIPGARLHLRVQDGGEVTCNRERKASLTSKQLIDARAIVTDLEGKEGGGPATRDAKLPPGRGSILRYDVRVEAGTVAFSDTSRGQPQAFYRLAKLVRDVARQACGLPR